MKTKTCIFLGQEFVAFQKTSEAKPYIIYIRGGHSLTNQVCVLRKHTTKVNKVKIPYANQVDR